LENTRQDVRISMLMRLAPSVITVSAVALEKIPYLWRGYAGLEKAQYQVLL